MFEVEEWDEGADGLALPRAVPELRADAKGSEPPVSAAMQRKRRQRLVATLRRLQAAGPGPGPGRDGEEARKRPGKRVRTERDRTAAEAAPEEPQPRDGGGNAGNEAELPPRVTAEPPRRNVQPAGGAGGSGAAAPRLSRKQWRNKQKNKRRQEKLKAEKLKAEQNGAGGGCTGRDEPEPTEPEPPEPDAVPTGRSAALRARMEERLLAARFRYINERLYTGTSRDAVELFRSDPEAFHIYHRGFALQVQRWPQNPVDSIIQRLRQRSASLVVADFGCGDCKIANSVRNKVHCFDLVPLSPLVTVCDMAKVPLADESVDIAVFCLALMGTNLQEILEEANRVLKLGGTLMVAEVSSRFEELRAFMNGMAQLGFKSGRKDVSSSFFFLLEFTKVRPPSHRPCPALRLLPCRYKRR
ncbi:ribosomal RNA-processing protein 8 isoform X2 [Coturnix japonica]|uniref:ribosomal RNA-processing protein 8 isoform X2 n=1 Tax=Coturnix japonica TaxID=93934 RepID=UPI000776B980|nr:ribosomal RNA-processing protein 8 isoform X2 [Coturnix japonica]